VRVIGTSSFPPESDKARYLAQIVGLTNLKMVSIIGCRASPSAINQFRKAHPKARLIVNLDDAQKYEQSHSPTPKEVLTEILLHDTYYVL
jgi:hypothetical protein